MESGPADHEQAGQQPAPEVPPPAVGAAPAPAQPPTADDATPPPVQPPVAEGDRREALALRVQQAVTQGYRVESQSDYQVFLAKGKRPNHILHLILTILTAGLWGLFVWLPLSIFKRERKMVLTVDQQGSVTATYG